MITLEHVSRRYRRGGRDVIALNDISLSIAKGEFVVVTGESGSGKSTLLQCIGCIDRPSEGTVLIEDINVGRLPDRSLSDIRQHSIGFVFQSFYLQPFLTLAENVAVPAMFAHTKQADIDHRVSKLLETVGLADRAKHYPSELSGGQIQRAAIARALINNPRIILADEPTGNLDSQNSHAIIDLFKQIQSVYGTTIVIVTHSEEVAQRADRTIRLKDGAIV